MKPVEWTGKYQAVLVLFCADLPIAANLFEADPIG